MRGGLQIAVVRGIPIRLHVTFLIVLPFLALAVASHFPEFARRAGIPPDALGAPWVWGLGIALALFASVLVHELAHSIYAIRKGGKVRAITLLLVGGVSEISEPPRTPGQEAVMAFVGPLTSLAIGAVALAARTAIDATRHPGIAFAASTLGQMNVFLAAFNLLPAFPMDGGRVLRGLLARRIGQVRATQIAARVGKVFAVLFAAGGFFSGNLLLVLIAFFVYLGAEAEARDVLVRAVLGELRVRDLMSRDVAALSADDPVYEAGERMLRERRVAYPVTREGAVAGLVTLELVEAVPVRDRPRTPVGRVMRTPAVLSPEDLVSDALRSLDREGAHHLAVAEEGVLVGTLSRQQIHRGLQLRELEASQHPRAGPRLRGSAAR
jgi:Zn-dependent protease/predicted transcriptional regulator